MHADRLRTDNNPAAVDGNDAPLSCHLHRTTHDEGPFLDNASWLVPRLKAPIGSVSAIREGLADRAQAQTRRNR